MIYAIINQCIILIRILFIMYSCVSPPTYDCCWNHSFILAHLFHYKTLDFSIGWFYKLALLDFELIFEVKMQESEGV